MKQKVIVKTMGEPDATLIVSGSETYTIRLIQALNWYSKEKDIKDAQKYFLDWLKKSNKSLLVKVEKNISGMPATYGWVARLLYNGATLSEKDIESFNRFVKSLAPVQQEEKKESNSGKSIQQAIKEKANDVLGELEYMLDEISLKTFDEKFTINSFLHAKELGTPFLPFIDSWARQKMATYVEVCKTKDPQVKEGYSNYTKADLLQILNFLKSIIEGVEAYGNVKKANRKPRARKARPAGVQVKSLKYKLSDDEFKLKSVPATEVVGSQQLWVFNCKSRKLGVYRSDTREGLQVKGTTIQNYVPEDSVQKTLRKPEEYLKKVLDGGKIVLRKLMADIKAKESALTGRINEDTILLRAIK